LGIIGSILNQIPSQAELKNIKTSPLFKSTYPKKIKNPFVSKNPKGQKGDTRPKGPVHSENVIYNKPRK
jgi:hypothetical protein